MITLHASSSTEFFVVAFQVLKQWDEYCTRMLEHA